MKIYLDIDGTMIHEDLTENYGKSAVGLANFIVALRPYDTYWLTTHCMDGDPIHAQEMMKKYLPKELHFDIDRIKPTVWFDKKTEALDWMSDFIWFDNDIFEQEWKDLEKCRHNQSVVQVDLRADPKQLQVITRDILIGGEKV